MFSASQQRWGKSSSLVLAAFAGALLLGCSDSGEAPQGGAGEQSVFQPSASPDDSNLSNEQAMALLRQHDQSFSDPFERVQIRYLPNPQEVQWLVDRGFAEGTFDNWQGANGAIKHTNPYASLIAIPTHRRELEIDGIATEGKRATIRYRINMIPNEPTYTIICVETRQAIVPNEQCDKPPITGSKQATRQDDGQWLLSGY